MSAKYMRVPLNDPTQSEASISLDLGSAFSYGNKYTIDRRYKSIFNYSNHAAGDYISTEIRETSVLSKYAHVVVVLLCYIFVALTFPMSLFFCFKSIPQYEEVVIFRLGRMQKNRGHGLIFILPCIDKIHKVDVRMRAFSVPPQQVITDDGAVVEIGANIYFRIAAVSKSVITVQDLNYSSRILFQTSLTKLVARKRLKDLNMEKAGVCRELQEVVNSAASSWGVEVTRVEIPQVKVLKEPNPPQLGQMMFPPGMALPPAFQQLTQAFMAATAPGGQGSHILPPGANVSDVTTLIEGFGGKERELSPLSSPEELIAAVSRVLSDTLVKQVDSIFQFEVTGEGGGTYFLDLKTYGGAVGEGAPPGGDPDATLTLDIEDMRAMFCQQLNPLQAYMSGRLLVSGDLSAAMKLEELLKRLNPKT